MQNRKRFRLVKRNESPLKQERLQERRLQRHRRPRRCWEPVYDPTILLNFKYNLHSDHSKITLVTTIGESKDNPLGRKIMFFSREEPGEKETRRKSDKTKCTFDTIGVLRDYHLSTLWVKEVLHYSLVVCRSR